MQWRHGVPVARTKGALRPQSGGRLATISDSPMCRSGVPGLRARGALHPGYDAVPPAPLPFALDRDEIHTTSGAARGVAALVGREFVGFDLAE